MAGTINGSTHQARQNKGGDTKTGPQAASLSPRSQLDWRAATGLGTIQFQQAFQAGRRAKTKPSHRSTRLTPPINLIDI
jgi:hypothetical protein